MAEPQIEIGGGSFGDVEMTGEAQSPTLVPDTEQTDEPDAPEKAAEDEAEAAASAARTPRLRARPTNSLSWHSNLDV